eukprot:TRINITY_DN492_c0_g2_i1.p1 TRINITY_DN492_c0_g2~~TRINITY_DN492_c0_g2_i1.p1  ORF type:complete len:263 (+),score=-5.69 TRINITY_DN492_c0_g2_i1:769-1557(+)
MIRSTLFSTRSFSHREISNLSARPINKNYKNISQTTEFKFMKNEQKFDLKEFFFGEKYNDMLQAAFSGPMQSKQIFNQQKINQQTFISIFKTILHYSKHQLLFPTQLTKTNLQKIDVKQSLQKITNKIINSIKKRRQFKMYEQNKQIVLKNGDNLKCTGKKYKCKIYFQNLQKSEYYFQFCSSYIKNYSHQNHHYKFSLSNPLAPRQYTQTPSPQNPHSTQTLNLTQQFYQQIIKIYKLKTYQQINQRDNIALLLCNKTQNS